MEPSSFDSLITDAQLEAVAGDVRGLLKPSIRLDAAPEDGSLSPGNSRLGGSPDVPGGFEWPEWNGKPMSFIAQIRLEDLTGFPAADLLPRSGLLSFFYDSTQQTYGASPSDRGGWLVTYFRDQQKLSSLPFPEGLAANARFTPGALTFTSEPTLPASAQQANSALKWTDTSTQRYESLVQNLRGPGDRQKPLHRMFGWPDQIQDDLQLQAAMMCAGVTDTSSPRFAALERDKSSWLLLLQVDSDARLGMHWASAGMLYFMIETGALKNREFANAWVVLQSD